MDVDFSGLSIKRLIIHEIPKRTAKDKGALLITTDGETPLEDSEKSLLSQKIRDSLTKSHLPVGFEEDSESRLPKFIQSLLSGKAGDDRFVGISQSMASDFYRCQTGVNPPGILAVIQAELDGKEALALVKLEKEEGIQLAPQQSDEGLALVS